MKRGNKKPRDFFKCNFGGYKVEWKKREKFKQLKNPFDPFYKFLVPNCFWQFILRFYCIFMQNRNFLMIILQFSYWPPASVLFQFSILFGLWRTEFLSRNRLSPQHKILWRKSFISLYLLKVCSLQFFQVMLF